MPDDTKISFHAGFPNPAENARPQALSLDNLLVKHPASTFFWRLASDIPDTAWRTGDILVVDRAAIARLHDLVVAIVNEDFILAKIGPKNRLLSTQNQPITEEHSLWGVVTYIVHPARRQP